MKFLSMNIPGYSGIKPPANLHLPDYYFDRPKILANFFTLALSLISIVSIGFLMWGGIQWILSEGDKQKVQAARGRITYAIIGLIIAFVSFFIIQVIGSIFSVDLLTLPFDNG